ncbi:AMP-dependent synthetase [Streptomyces ipomoeae]|uniref:AMP-dependent synthetase n=1 Tax=Streptomyces ipomoeae TaxID=103232 RepID=A0AAE8VZ99_9ACTN|nr:AMP-binding protein [Streptomyces ipomoeae]MDX2823939.1 AMP-binding protein [Streptomyces ipomoeae]MDX2876529.1 AMP-binding protein [Streptomyces ipomoeae]TQE28402.1 AMP-dependent synthetase [Streptomyces ipomoeae]TQE37588.1 AMP-dependent synthetase [Streptomyces ipomoeae]
MTDDTLGRLVSTEPAAGHISFASLLGTRTITLSDLYRRSGRVARWLRGRGVRPGDRIGILAANSLEWVLLDLAALRLKAETAGLEPGKFDPTGELMRRYDLKLLFTDRPADAPGTVPMSEVTEAAERENLDGPPLEPVSWGPKDVTTIKFTSGSTGEPKGLGATAGSIDSSLRAVQEIFEHGPGDDLFMFLPLSLLQQRYWIYSALLHGHDVTVSTYEAAFAALRRVRPTVVMGVPAFYETAKRQIEARLRRADGQSPEQAAQAVFGDRIRYLWTGSAPAAPDTLRFFDEAGLPIYEGYGLNETCIVTKNHPKAHREGSVGQVLRGKEVLIGEDGVIRVRSEHPVNDHYTYAKPGDSERVFEPDGTVRTGDLGYLDEDGFLFVRGRADDVIVLDNGKKVVVRPIEEHMKADPAIADCVLFCPGQTELVAVVSPASVPADREAIAARLALTNASLTPDERISRVVVADEPFSIDNGLLTSQYKPKRQRILAVHHDAVHDPEEGMHAP